MLELIESNTLIIQPDTLRNEILSFVRSGLKDLSISRTSVKWGIPVPGHPGHVIYVWLDALANYMTAVGYGSDKPEDIAKFERYWPADLHLIGKEIARFHCVYWPAFLLAAKLPLPKKIAANGWLLFNDSKMSKSKGNVVRIETILDSFGKLCPPVFVSSRSEGEGSASAVSAPGDERKGTPSGVPQTAHENAGALAPEGLPQRLTPESDSGVGGTAEAVPLSNAPSKAQQDLFATDVMRYFLLREVPYGQDGNFSLEAMVTRYNDDLANGYGNLVSRTLSMIQKYLDGTISEATAPWIYGGAIAIVPADLVDLAAQRIVETPSIIEAITSRRGVEENFDKSLRLDSVTMSIGSLIKVVDIYLSAHEPWKLAKSEDETDRFGLIEVLYTAAESIRIITALLYPILPYATASVWRQLGLGDIEEGAHSGQLKDLQWGGLKPGTKLGPLAPIFPRADKGLIDTMIQMEQDQNTPISHANAAHDAAENTLSEFPEMSLASATVQHEAPDKSVPSSVESVVSLSPSDASPQIGIDDFAKVELRVAKVLVAERIPKADKLLRLEVDLGYEQRQILSGIAEWYTPEELIGRRIVVITNLAPRKMRGLESHGMLLAASTEGGKPYLATFADSDALPLGSRLK